ncbi:ATP-binding protein [Paraburkholderia megapolitana]|uniref:AAA domain-containing protein n=1 Tax=Paraburkholderia megapolitana TaxID=420953 RepID=A0A1I3VYE9_9BURK|nr:ATP-binding protein [Paraburkholderia megapolitana]QDQ82180.1 ATP-binding protein [Paraburkholderia megapolitana]SFK00190.1 AAA domain-containing protein [Paraburkholderia megapolitana]
MSLHVPRPIDPSLHPLVTGNYRIATPAIETLYDLVGRCLRYRIMGALIYGPPRIGKTRAIEYVRLLLAREYPKMTSYHAQCEHKPRHAEGPFFANLLEAIGDHDPNAGSNPAKRMRVSLRIREAAARAGSGTVLLFCDEAQRYNENEYEWLRDVHDALDRQQIRLLTFLVGQQELLAQKTALQIARKTQIVARLMVEELAFYGIRDAGDVATCLNGYDQTAYPEGTQWSFTRFYVPQAFDAGYRLVNDAAVLWKTFEAAHHKASLPGNLEIPMESFARAVEIALKDSELKDAPGYCPEASLWAHAVHHCGYVQSRHAIGRVLAPA